MSSTPSPQACKHCHRRNNTSHQKKLQTVMEYLGYKMIKTIGSGGFGNVKLALTQKNNKNKKIAIKIINKMIADPDIIQSFVPREIEIVKKLSHPFIIRYYQVIETTHRIYILMEYASNGSIGDVLEKEVFISEDKARKWFKQLVETIEYLHSNGVVHRDIKLDNLLLDGKYNLKLCDFGLARPNMSPVDVGVYILSETYCGTYEYVSPEVQKGEPYQPQLADFWSMGVCLYIMLYGQMPFSPKHRFEKSDDYEVHFFDNPIVTWKCQELISKMLAPLIVRKEAKKKILSDPWLNEDM